MKEDRAGDSTGTTGRSWLERLGQALAGGPEDRDDLKDILKEAQARGIIDAEALSMMEGALAVAERQVRDVMIPRGQMIVMQADWSVERLLAEIIESGHSRLPVIGEDRDEVLGILLVKDLLRWFASGAGEFDLRSFLRAPTFIPESKRLDVLLREFRANRLHMAIVVDEYGGVAGLVTIEDLIEQIVGEIDDEHDEAGDDGDIRQIGEHEYIVRALTPLADFNARFDAHFDEDEADTVGGLVLLDLERVPKRGEVVEIERFRFRVLRADNRRVHLFGLTVLDPVVPAADGAV